MKGEKETQQKWLLRKLDVVPTRQRLLIDCERYSERTKRNCVLKNIYRLRYSTICCLQSVSDLIYCVIHYILTLFYFFQVLVKPFLHLFSVLVSRLFICDSILISRFWIIFTIIIQNSVSGRFPISSSFVWFGGQLSCSFTC